VGFDIDQLLIKYSAFIRSWRRNRTVLQLFIDFKQTYDSIRRISIEFGIPMNLVRLIKICKRNL